MNAIEIAELLEYSAIGNLGDFPYVADAAKELRRLAGVEADRAAQALADVLGIELPQQNENDPPMQNHFPDATKMVSGNQLDDISVVELEEPLQVKMADILAIQLDEAKRGDPYSHGLYNGMLYMVAAHDGGEYKPIGKEDFYTNGTGNPLLEQVILNVIHDGTAGVLVSAEGIGIPEPVTELINPAQGGNNANL